MEPKTYLDLLREHCETYDDFVQSEIAHILFQDLGQALYEFGFSEEDMNSVLNLIARPIWLIGRKY